MKILIAGLGSIGRRHFRNLLALGERDLLLYRSKLSTLPDDELVGYPVVTDLWAALDQQPEAVIISNPTSMHLDVAIPCARAGCNLFIEKPVSSSMEHIPELQSALEQGGGKVLVGYHFRHHPNLQRAKELINSGAIGSPLSIRAEWGEYLPGWHPWENYQHSYSARHDLGGGVILTLSHPLDYLRWIFGEVDALWAFSSKRGDLNIQVEDTAEIGLRFKSGEIASLHLDYNQRPSVHSLEVTGTGGILCWEGIGGALEVAFHQNGKKDETLLLEGLERNDVFLAEMQHFLQVCRGETRSVCTLEDGVKTLQLALAAHASQELGKLIIL
jgi:predicted dehydrogenase